ncbi:MAG: HEAT repeat domain-containing protein [Myxacorys chilensis ATA2-1-KO14]|jgi:HEAT repeat protein|nr:HEAT repeat domain-containing protein [Myxacorys chilensis ATA2-1-KO14]
MFSQFQSYLQSIATTYKKSSEPYTPTDAQGRENIRAKQSAPFDFGLMVQTVKREEREQQNEEKVERFPVLEGIRQYADQHVLLVGRPGSGKSTALARLMLEEAEAALTPSPSPKLGRGEEEWRIPVLVELRYWQSSIEQLILNSLTRHGLSADQFEAVLSRSLLLFDGVNELPSEEARSQLSAFRRNHPKLPMIFTTRDLSLGGDLGIEKKLEMQPLTEAQMQAFVQAYLSLEQAEQMLRQLKERLREFGQTPLLLWMLCGLFQQTGTIPENLGMVFREFTQGYERYLKEDVRIESDRGWWKPVLQQLAWVMMQGEKPTEIRVAIGKEEAVRAIAQFLNGKVAYAEDFARKCLRDLQKHHLIQAGTNPEELEFRHQLIQEYYAAESLLNGVAGQEDELLKRDFLNYLKWTEPVALMLALVEDETQTVRVVKLALEVDWRLGARLAGEVKREFQEQTVGLVNALNVTNWLKIKLLGETRSDCSIESLLQFVEDSDSAVRMRTAEALGKVGSEQAIHALLQLVEDANFYVRRSAAEALGKVGSEQAIHALLQLVEHSDSDVRMRAAEALGKVGSEQAIPALLQLVEDADSAVRMSAAEALGKVGSEQAIPALLQLVEDANFYVRRSAAEALGKVGSEQAIPALLQLVEDANFYVRGRAAEALGKVGSEQAIPALLQLVEDADSAVRRSAAEALGKVGSEQAIHALLQLVEHSDSAVRWSAINALGNISSEQAIPALLKLVEDAESFVRMSAAEALGKVGSEQAIPALLQLVEDADSFVRMSAAEALGKVGSEQAIPALLKLVEDADSFVRWRAAEALGKVGSEQAIPALLKLVEDAESFVRWRAAEALGKVGSKQTIPALLQLVEDADSFVRSSAINALGNISSEQAIPALLQLVEHSDSDVRRIAAAALGGIAKKYTNSIAQHLPHLLTLIQSDSGQDAHRTILAIQENCKYYNYEIYQSYLEEQKSARQKSQNSDRPATIYNFPNATEAKIFEQVDQYHEALPKDPPS